MTSESSVINGLIGIENSMRKRHPENLPMQFLLFKTEKISHWREYHCFGLANLPMIRRCILKSIFEAKDVRLITLFPCLTGADTRGKILNRV